jgi:hypothetical protein
MPVDLLLNLPSGLRPFFLFFLYIAPLPAGDSRLGCGIAGDRLRGTPARYLLRFQYAFDFPKWIGSRPGRV